MMIDLSAFSEEKFDAKKWINTACQNRHPQETLEKQLVDLEMKLQMMSEEIAASLEEQSAAALLRVPRATRDVIRLRDDAVSLRHSVSSILLKLKKDAAGLTQLSSTVEDVFASGDLPKAAETLANMRHCLSAVGEVAEFANIRKQLEVLEDRLDSMVQPRLTDALSNRKVEVAQDLREFSFGLEVVCLKLLAYTVMCRCMIAFLDDYKTLVPKLLIETMATIGSNFVSRINLATGDVVAETKALAKGILDILSGDMQKGIKIQSKHLEALIELHNMTGTFARNVQHLFSESNLPVLLDTLKAVYLPYESFKQRALLCKWNWRFAIERENFWRHVISRKFGEEEGGWSSRDVRESYRVGFWKEIRKEGALMQNKVSFLVGNGRRVKFWKDIWWGNFPLCNSFPSLYAFASSKEAWVEEFWDTSGVEGVWSPRFSRPFNDWEVEEVERLLLTIRGARLSPLMEDRMRWKVTSNGSFSVKSLYNDLSSRRAGLFPHGLIWNPSVPSKVCFFAWEASWGKVLTMDQLKKRGWAVANRCFLCCEEEESIDHILIHCSKARVLWELLFALFGVCWVLPSSARETLIEWRGFMLGKKHRKVWKAAPLCLFWAVWMERNRIAFDNEDFSVHRNISGLQLDKLSNCSIRVRMASMGTGKDPESVKTLLLVQWIRYGQMERVILSSEIAGVDLRGAVVRGVGAQGIELSETVRRMEESIPQVILFLDEAVERCISFTGGSEIDELILALDDIMLQYISTLQETLKSLRAVCGVDTGDGGGTKKEMVSDRKEGTHNARKVDLMSNEEEWSIVQGALQILTVADCLTSRSAVFEASLKATLARLSTSLSLSVFGSNLDQNQSHVASDDGNGESSMIGRAALDVASVRLVDVPEKARRLFNL
ncbi:putative ribonuclease H protein [Vitis vinifera]|uniref:Conserved oligomeric Golgi complex subunit 7 n=1 Tax=Vitis vinifera TaxID=29760 RepID=A0A438H2S5_VITVI|nr:putative ribonuclease H protein [Vitis vinifera]